MLADCMVYAFSGITTVRKPLSYNRIFTIVVVIIAVVVVVVVVITIDYCWAIMLVANAELSLPSVSIRSQKCAFGASTRAYNVLIRSIARIGLFFVFVCLSFFQILYALTPDISFQMVESSESSQTTWPRVRFIPCSKWSGPILQRRIKQRLVKHPSYDIKADRELSLCRCGLNPMVDKSIIFRKNRHK